MKPSLNTATLLGVGVLGAGLALSGCHRPPLIAMGEVLEEKILDVEGFSTPRSYSDTTQEKYYTITVRIDEGPLLEKDDDSHFKEYTINIKPTPNRPLEFMNSMIEKGSVVLFQYFNPRPLSSTIERLCPEDGICTIPADRLYVVRKEGEADLLKGNLTQTILYYSCLTWPNECDRAAQAAAAEADIYYNF